MIRLWSVRCGGWGMVGCSGWWVIGSRCVVGWGRGMVRSSGGWRVVRSWGWVVRGWARWVIGSWCWRMVGWFWVIRGGGMVGCRWLMITWLVWGWWGCLVSLPTVTLGCAVVVASSDVLVENCSIRAMVCVNLSVRMAEVVNLE